MPTAHASDAELADTPFNSPLALAPGTTCHDPHAPNAG